MTHVNRHLVDDHRTILSHDLHHTPNLERHGVLLGQLPPLSQKEYELERVLDDLFDSPIPDPLQTPRTRGRVADWLQIELDDLFGGSPSKKTCRRQQQQPEEEVQDSQQDFWR